VTPKDSLKMWIDRVKELEDGLEEAIRLLKLIHRHVQFSAEQKEKLEAKIEYLENIFIPF
jgi:hypothetical protein